MENSSHDSISDENMQYMHYSPVYNIDQQRKYDHICGFGKELTELTNAFGKYVEIGRNLCEQMNVIKTKLSNTKVYQIDKNANELNELINKIYDGFEVHIAMVQDTIVSRVDSFVQREFESMKNLQSEHNKTFEAFQINEEKYISMPTNAKESTKKQTEQSLIQSHSLSTLTFYDFSKKMESIEIRMGSLIPQIFIALAEAIKKPFGQIFAHIDEFEPSIETMKERLDASDATLRDFKSNTAQTKQALSSTIPAYWARLNSPFTGCNEMSLQGYLWKKCGRFPVSWKKRFFTVGECVLSYADDVDSLVHDARNISLLLCSVKADTTQPRLHCFTISTKGRSYTLQAVTEWEMNHWLAVIQNNIFSHINSTGIKEEDDALAEEAAAFTCADCGAEKATWASINWGVSLCDECIGCHRALPSTISRARSIQLDDIEHFQRLVFDAIGSERANSILEKNVGTHKIERGCERDIRLDFIKRKYVLKEFVDRTKVSIIDAIVAQDLDSVFRWVAQGNLTPKGNSDQKGNFTPLHAAAAVGNPIILTFLLLNSTDADPIDEGWTPLSYAAYYGNQDAVVCLLNFGAFPTAAAPSAHPSALAAANHHESVSEMLLSFPAEPSSEKPPHPEVTPQPFDLACYVDPEKVQKRLLRRAKGGIAKSAEIPVCKESKKQKRALSLAAPINF